MDESLSLGAWIRRRRRALDLTQAELARRVGVAEITVQKIEADERRPSRQVAARLAEHLQLPSAEREAFVRAARAELSPGRLADPTALAASVAATSPGNLPAETTSLIGRSAELATIESTLLRDDVRLLTLTGPGGIGKTRLALRAAAALAPGYPDGAWLVDLTPVRDPAQVPAALAHALAIQDVGAHPSPKTLAAYLRRRSLLLVVDNAEHVVEAAPLLADLLRAAPGLKLIVTSRVPLRLLAEHQHVVPPLSVPPEGQPAHPAALAAYDSAALFLARAGAADDRFELSASGAEAVAAICRRLEGLPLAIELAAARVRQFPPAALLERIEREGELAVLRGGPRDLPVRHQTLRATIVWSHALLAPAEAALLARLGVFPGSFDMDAALALGAGGDGSAAEVPDLLAALVDASLVRAVGEGPAPRYVLLEPVREFAREQLAERGELAALQERHAAYFAALAEAAEPELRCAAQLVQLRRLDGEYANLRAALSWAEASDDARQRLVGLRIAGALWYYWFLRGRFAEAYRWLDAPWSHDERQPAAARARALLGGWVIRLHGSGGSSSHSSGRAGLALARQAGDPWLLAFALAVGSESTEEWAEAGALAERIGDPWLLAFATAFHQQVQGWFAARMGRETLARARAAGDRHVIVVALCGCAHSLWVAGEAQESLRLLDEALAEARALGGRFTVACSIYYLDGVSELLGNIAAAREREAERLAHERALGNAPGVEFTLGQMALLAAWQGDYTAAGGMLDEAQDLDRGSSDLQRWGAEPIVLACMALARGDIPAAERSASAALDVATEVLGSTRGTFVTWPAVISRWLMGALHAARGDIAASAEHYRRGLALAEAHSGQCEPGPGNGLLLHICAAGLPYAAGSQGDTAAGRAWLEDALGTMLSATLVHIPALADAVRGQFLQHSGDVLGAATHLAAALRFYRRAEARMHIAWMAEGLASAALAGGDAARAARLWGAAAATRAAIGAQMWPVDRAAYEQQVAAARAALGDASFSAAWAAGQAQTWQQAAAEALGETDSA